MNTLSTAIRRIVESRSGRRWPEPVVGNVASLFDDVFRVGGTALPERLTPPVLLVGTEAQFSSWKSLLVEQLIPHEYLNFIDLGYWEAQCESLVDETSKFLSESGDHPVLLWITPLMALIGRKLAAEGRKPSTCVRDVKMKQSAHSRIPLHFQGQLPYELTAGSALFTPPPEFDDETELHRVYRARYDEGPDGRRAPQPYSREYLVYRAHPDAHKQQLDSAFMPANQEFYETDFGPKTEATGWIRTPHVTLLKLHRSTEDEPQADYLAHRFHREHGARNSLIHGIEDFDSFVDHHPSFRRLVELAVRQ